MIVEVSGGDGLAACVPVVRRAFRTVMDERGLSEADVPTNAAFITLDRLSALRAAGARFFAVVEGEDPVGCVCLRFRDDPADDSRVAVLEHLAVVPERRHLGHGAALVRHAVGQARVAGAGVVRIAVIDDNVVLKRWYLRAGFTERDRRVFPHLPFAVCYLEKVVRTG